MRLCILNADHLDKEITEQFGDYPAMFKALFTELFAEPFTEQPQRPKYTALDYLSYQVIDGQYPKDINNSDAYLITGSKSSAYDDTPWIQALESFIQTLHQRKKPMIGICFGHQLIAKALGGQVAKSPSGWGVGIKTYTLNPDTSNPDTSNLRIKKGPQFDIIYSHQDQVLQLPTGSVLLAGNEFCPHVAFQHEKHILCFQGHPEFSKSYCQFLLTKRRQRIGEQTYLTAVDSLKKNTDHLLVAGLIMDFLNQVPET